MSLLQRWRTKNALEAELKKQLPMLSRIVASYEADADLQQELLQEVVVAAWQASSQFEGRAKAKTFFARIAHNRCVTHIDTAVRKPQWSGGEDPEAIVSYDSDKALQLEALQKQIRSLPLQQRQIMTLFLEGFSYNEIAQVCDIKSSNVGVIINRTKQSLTEFFNEDHR